MKAEERELLTPTCVSCGVRADARGHMLEYGRGGFLCTSYVTSGANANLSLPLYVRHWKWPIRAFIPTCAARCTPDPLWRNQLRLRWPSRMIEMTLVLLYLAQRKAWKRGRVQRFFCFDVLNTVILS
jgi:hypothetical protein